MLDVYRVVKSVRDREEWHNELGHFEYGGLDLDARISLSGAKLIFNENRKHKLSYSRLKTAFQYAIDEHYLETGILIRYNPIVKDNKLVKQIPLEVESVWPSKKGRRLIDTIPGLPFLPYGLLKAWWKEDGKIVLAMLGAIITLLGIIAVTLIKILLALRS
jgi:hypothetical protein